MNPVKFSRKTLPQKEGLGEKLAKKRVAMGMTTKDVEKAIRVRASFVDEIEGGRYENLPPDVFVRGFVKSYAEFLKLDSNKVLRIYRKERGLIDDVQKANAKPPIVKPLSGPRVLVTPRTLIVAFSVLVVLVIASYIGWQVKILTAPPKLTLQNPANNLTINSESIGVEGVTDSGATLKINDVEVGVDQDGEFKEKVSLQSGVNTIKVRSQNKLGRYTEISRIVVANIPALAVPTTQQVGLELKLTIGPKSASIQVEIDGKKVTEKPVIVLAGVTQTFKANEKIIVTTNNAGSVRAIYNSQDVGVFGKDGETIKKEYTKGMQIK